MAHSLKTSHNYMIDVIDGACPEAMKSINSYLKTKDKVRRLPIGHDATWFQDDSLLFQVLFEKRAS